MREPADDRLIRAFMEAVGRVSTIDIDLMLAPVDDRLYRELPSLKEALRLNIELANPSDFIPEVPGWQGRSLFIERRGHA